MKYDQFSITEIELTHDQAIQLKIDCINAIDNYGIENFEAKKQEIDVPHDDDDPIECSITCQMFSELDDQAAPFEPTVIDRSVHLSIKLFNADGGEVKWKVKGERLCKNSKMFTRTPIDVEEEIIKHFTI